MTITKYTPQQGDILDWTTTEDGITMVSAGAGTGKSFMAEHITRALKPKKALYTAFNKAIVMEGNTRFKGVNMECKTLHALAYRYVKDDGIVDVSKIEDFTYSCIKENMCYAKKALIIKAMDMFFVSSSSEMYMFLDDYFKSEKDSVKLAETCSKYINKMIEGTISPTFNFLLKYFHLLLLEGSIDCSYDLVILDEINDTTAVALEIFKLIDAPKKLGLGETNQAIYQFLNLVDGFELLKDEKLFPLTQSFRCSTNIAQRIQSFMQAEVSDEFKFVGTDNPVMNGKFLYCTMTNALIIDRIHQRLTERKGFKLLRKPADIFACPLALITVSGGREPYQKKYKFLMEEYNYFGDLPQGKKKQSFFQYLLENVEDTEIQNAVKLLLSFKSRGIDLFQVYKNTKAARVDEGYTISTVFTSKGLEFETVEIANDLNTKIQAIRDAGGVQSEEDLVAYRCYYVACSRAGKNLYNAIRLP